MSFYGWKSLFFFFFVIVRCSHTRTDYCRLSLVDESLFCSVVVMKILKDGIYGKTRIIYLFYSCRNRTNSNYCRPNKYRNKLIKRTEKNILSIRKYKKEREPKIENWYNIEVKGFRVTCSLNLFHKHLVHWTFVMVDLRGILFMVMKVYSLFPRSLRSLCIRRE